MSQSSEQAEKMGCKKCGGIKRHAESCKLNTWFLTDPLVPSMVHDDERGSGAQSSEQGAPELLPCPYCDELPEIRERDGEFRIDCRNYDKCEMQPRTLLAPTKEEATTAWNIQLVNYDFIYEKMNTRTRSDICASLVEALKELLNAHYQGKVQTAQIVAARAALAKVKTDDK